MKAVVWHGIGDIRLEECGYCSFCRSGYYVQCDNARPRPMATSMSRPIRYIDKRAISIRRLCRVIRCASAGSTTALA